jgi:glycerol-3-phosphate acyltransferase PlsY
MLSRIIFVALAYLLGSIPFGYLLVKYLFTTGEDVRKIGSGGIGATNVTRRAGLKAGLLTYLFDFTKGLAALALMRQIAGDDHFWIGAAAVAAVAGHIFPIFLRFRGGKGVATGAGVILALAPYAMLSGIVVWAVIVYFTRYVSLGSIVATATVPLWIWFYYGLLSRSPHLGALIMISIIIAALVIGKHHENIARLIKGTESKFGERIEPRATPAEPDRTAMSGGQG